MVTATLPGLPLTTDQNKMVSPISSFLLRLNFHSMSQLNSSLGPQFAPCHGPLVPSCYSLLQPPYSEPPLQSDWTTPAPKQGNTFSPQPFTPLSAKNLPFFLSPAQLGLLFSSLNLIYFVKDRYSKPSSPLSNSWSAHDTHWEMASGRCTPYCFVCWSCLFTFPISKGHGAIFLWLELLIWWLLHKRYSINVVSQVKRYLPSTF